MKAPPRLAPAVLREVEHDPVDVLEFLFGVDAGIVGQFHEEFAAVTLDLLLGCALVLDDEADMVQSPRRAVPSGAKDDRLPGDL